MYTNKETGEVTRVKPDDMKSNAEKQHDENKKKMAKKKEGRGRGRGRGR